MLAVMKKLTYDDEYNFENEVSVPPRRVDGEGAAGGG